MVGMLNDSDSEDELPPGWEERASVDGNVYYVKWVIWQYFIYWPFEWNFVQLLNWFLLFSHFTKCTQWTHPQTGRKKIVKGELPSGWEKCISNDGEVLFVDHVNRTTTYTDPRLAFATECREQSQPIRQRFDGSTTALAILYGRDLRNKTALITGANTGIGDCLIFIHMQSLAID